MVPQPEQQARKQIDTLLAQAGWQVCDPEQVNLTAYRGVAIREFPLPGHGFADYLLYIDGRVAGVKEANRDVRMSRGQDERKRLAVLPSLVGQRCL